MHCTPAGKYKIINKILHGLLKLQPEAISMSDRIVVLTTRPATVKIIYDINFEMEGRNPLSARESPKFSKYFDSIWKELDVNA